MPLEILKRFLNGLYCSLSCLPGVLVLQRNKAMQLLHGQSSCGMLKYIYFNFHLFFKICFLYTKNHFHEFKWPVAKGKDFSLYLQYHWTHVECMFELVWLVKYLFTASFLHQTGLEMVSLLLTLWQDKWKLTKESKAKGKYELLRGISNNGIILLSVSTFLTALQCNQKQMQFFEAPGIYTGTRTYPHACDSQPEEHLGSLDCISLQCLTYEMSHSLAQFFKPFVFTQIFLLSCANIYVSTLMNSWPILFPEILP